jgi:hypothetical protein
MLSGSDVKETCYAGKVVEMKLQIRHRPILCDEILYLHSFNDDHNYY